MKIYVALFFFAVVTAGVVESQAQGRSISNRLQDGNIRVGRNSARHDESIGARGNSAKSKNPPRHREVGKPIHNKPIQNKPIHHKPTPNKFNSKKPDPNKPTSNKLSPNKPTLNKFTPSKPTPKKPAPINLVANKPTPNKPTTNNPTHNKSPLNKPILPNSQTNQQKDNKLDLKNTKTDTNVNAEREIVQTKPISTIQAGKAVDNKINSASINAPTLPQKNNKSRAPNNIKDTKDGDSARAQVTVVDEKPGSNVKAKKEIINKNGNAASVKFGASQQEGSKPDLFVGIEGTKEILYKNDMVLFTKATATQHIASKPEVSLGITGAKNGGSVNAEVKMVDETTGWDITGAKKFVNKNGNEVTLTTGASQKQGSKPEVFFGIQNAKGGSDIEAQANFVNGNPGLSIEGTNVFYNKNGVSKAVNAGVSLQKGREPEGFVGIKATKDGDSLNARLNMVDNKLGWDIKGKKKIYDKNGVDISLNAGVQQQAGGKPEGTVGLEVNIG